MARTGNVFDARGKRLADHGQASSRLRSARRRSREADSSSKSDVCRSVRFLERFRRHAGTVAAQGQQSKPARERVPQDGESLLCLVAASRPDREPVPWHVLGAIRSVDAPAASTSRRAAPHPSAAHRRSPTAHPAPKADESGRDRFVAAARWSKETDIGARRSGDLQAAPHPSWPRWRRRPSRSSPGWHAAFAMRRAVVATRPRRAVRGRVIDRGSRRRRPMRQCGVALRRRGRSELPVVPVDDHRSPGVEFAGKRFPARPSLAAATTTRPDDRADRPRSAAPAIDRRSTSDSMLHTEPVGTTGRQIDESAARADRPQRRIRRIEQPSERSNLCARCHRQRRRSPGVLMSATTQAGRLRLEQDARVPDRLQRRNVSPTADNRDLSSLRTSTVPTPAIPPAPRTCIGRCPIECLKHVQHEMVSGVIAAVAGIEVVPLSCCTPESASRADSDSTNCRYFG